MGQYGADGGSDAPNGHDDARNGVQAGLFESSVVLLSLANGVLDALPDSLAVLDQSGTIVAVNRAWETFARENGGPSVTSSSIGTNYLAVCQAASHDAIARQVLHGLRAILAGTEMCFVLEYPCHSPTRQRWFLLRAVPAPGDQRGAVVVHTNITARKLSELALTDQKRRYDALLASSPDHIFLLDLAGRFTFVNPAAAAANGRPADAIVGHTARELGLPPRFVRQFERQQARARAGKAVAAETPFPTPRGVRRFEYVLSPIYAEDGRLEAIAGITRDIEERTRLLDAAKTARREATQRAQELEAVFAAIPDGFLVMDQRGRVTRAGGLDQTLLGPARNEDVAERAQRLALRDAAGMPVAAEQVPAMRVLRGEVLSGDHAVDVLARTANGRHIELSVTGGPMYGARGQLAGGVLIYRDVSELQRVQAARREAEEANKDLHQLQTLTDTLQAHVELDELLAELLRRVCDVMAVQNAVILLLADDGQQLVVRAAHGLEEGVHAEVTIPLGQGFAGRIAASRAPLIVDDLSTFPVVRRFLREHLRSALGVPLVLRERVLGVLHVDTVEPHHFTEQEVQLLQRVAERVALAVERAQLFQAEREARREAEAALARALASESRFHRLVDSGIIGIVVGDGERVIEANDAYLQMVGYTRHDLLAGNLTREALLMRQEMVAASEYAETEALEKGVSRPFDSEYIRKDGSRVPMLLGVALLQREPPLFVSFVVDLSDQKRLERSLRESEQLFRATFEQAAVGMARVAPDGSWLDVNQRLCELVGYSREELAERTFQDLTYSDTLTADLASRRQMLTGERDHYETDKRYARKDGTLVWVHLTVSLVRDTTGVPQYFVSVIEDISARKQAEREREEARASELAAQDVTRQLDEFFATAAHDIRTPLTALIGNVDLARLRAQRLLADLEASGEQDGRDGTLAARLMMALDNAGASSQRLQRLVAVLFDVSRARTGMLALTFAPRDLRTLVGEQVAAQQTATPGRTIAMDLPDQPVVVLADADRLGQVLTNYLSNAVKYSAEDRPVTVRLEVTAGLAVVSVQDRGPGLPAEELHHVWELYHRARGVTAQSETGGIGGSLGLGLHICKRLIELHPGGQVGVESVVGQGSTFWFRLPLAADRASHASNASDACAT